MTLLSGFFGALVGALVAWVVTGRQIKAQERAREKEILREIVADFLAATSRMWRTQQALGYAVYELVYVKEDQPNLNAEERRQAAFTEIRPASHEADHALALLRIMYTDLTELAQTLADASRNFMVRDEGKTTEEYETEREAARCSFEAAVRPLLVATRIRTWSDWRNGERRHRL